MRIAIWQNLRRTPPENPREQRAAACLGYAERVRGARPVKQGTAKPEEAPRRGPRKATAFAATVNPAPMFHSSSAVEPGTPG